MSSQPVIKKKQVQLGDLMLASAITLSGNNYAKVALLFRFSNLAMVSESAMDRFQTHCIVPVVNDHWLNMQHSIIQDAARGKDLVIAILYLY